MRNKKVLVCAVALLAVLGLAACGKKIDPNDIPPSFAPIDLPKAMKEGKGTVNGFDYEISACRYEYKERGYVIDTLNQPDSPYFYYISSGEKSSGGYGIYISDISADNDGNVTITVLETNPGPEESVTEALTYPSILVTVYPQPTSVRIVDTKGVEFEEIDMNSNESGTNLADAYKNRVYSSEAIACDGLYKKFLDGEEPVYFEETKDGYLSYIFDEWCEEPYRLDYSKGYTLNEMIDVIEGGIYPYEDWEIGTCKYYTVDLGNDGDTELCVELSDFDMSIPDWDYATFVIKEFDGKLKCVYCFLGMARWSYGITYYGVVQGGGASGAGSHGYDEGFLDANGKYHLLYKSEENYPGWYSYYDDAFSTISQKLTSLEEEGYETVTVTTSFDDKKGGDYLTSIYVYNGDYEEVSESDPKYASIKKIFTDQGIKLTSYEESEDIIRERCQKVGVTDEMRDSDICVYHELFHIEKPEEE